MKNSAIISHNSKFFGLMADYSVFLTMRNHRTPKIFDNAQV